MPRELFLVRHAEAESSSSDVKDIERTLTSDGEIVASKIGKFLVKLINTPDLILSSNSKRTVTTTELLSEQLQYNPVQIEFMEDLYEASTRILLRVINEIDAKHNKVILVGHNPSISFLSEYITGSEIGNVSSGGVVHIKFDCDWKEVSEKNATLVQYYDSSLLQ